MNWIAQDRAAWNAGFAAGEPGQTVTTCPYPAAAEESLAWYSGFIDAVLQYQARVRQARAKK